MLFKQVLQKKLNKLLVNVTWYLSKKINSYPSVITEHMIYKSFGLNSKDYVMFVNTKVEHNGFIPTIGQFSCHRFKSTFEFFMSKSEDDVKNIDIKKLIKSANNQFRCQVIQEKKRGR